MLSGEKVLITGPAGRIAFGLARSLVADNEVWGIARLSDPATRDKVEALGVTTRKLDYSDGEFGDLPTDFTHLLHLAADFSDDDYERAIRVNAEGTGLLLEHCRKAKAALVMSTVSVYKPNPDPWHPFREDDPLGDIMLPGQATYSISKVGEEAVARYCARAYDLPITIARMGSAYSDQGACRSGTSTPSPPASPCARVGTRCRTARSTTTTSARNSKPSSTQPASRPPS
jgi:nucleoside-diphosphate-sugar epimerase